MLTTPEFTIEHSSLSFQSGVFLHAHFRLRDEWGDEHIRAVALKELACLPIETRDDPAVLGKQWAALQPSDIRKWGTMHKLVMDGNQ